MYAFLLVVAEECSGFRHVQDIFAFSIPSTSGSGTRPAPVKWVSQDISLQMLEADHSLPYRQDKELINCTFTLPYDLIV
jgi:hypothetical protein